MEATTRPSAVFALAFCMVTVGAMFILTIVVPLDTLAAPNQFIYTEIAVAALVCAVFVTLGGRVERAKWRVSLFGFLDRKLSLPWPARLAALAFTVVCGFVWAFFALMDDLGGYNGPWSTLERYSSLQQLYNLLGLGYLAFWKVGTVAFVFFGLALLGLVVALANRGFGAAIKDSLTLFAAPVTIIFELGLWYYAPEDMTWHATSFLWIGGINDHGYRAQSLAAGVTYYPINNWIVLFVALFLLASRIPAIWRREVSAEGDDLS
jgi:hypothetical protein